MARNGTPRRVVERRNREVEVVDAAVEVFYRKGYAAASIQDVAERVGVLKGSLYHYISSKEDLLFRIFEGSHEQAVALMDDVAERGLPPRQHLEAYVNELVHWYLGNLERVSLYFNEWPHLTGENAAAVRAHREVFYEYLHAILVAGRDRLRTGGDTRLATFFVLGAINNIPDWYRKAGFSAARVASEFATMSANLAFDDSDRGGELTSR